MHWKNRVFDAIKESEYLQVFTIILGYLILDNFFFRLFYYGFTITIPKVYEIVGVDSFLAVQVPYFDWSIFFGALKNPIFILAFIGIHIPLAIKSKNITWDIFKKGRPLKYFIFFITVIITWAYATYDYNHYLNQAHYFDRLLLILLSILVLRSPVFVPSFLLISILIMSQFNYPIGGYTLTDKKLLFNILTLFISYFFTHKFFNTKVIIFFFLAFCLHASNYFIPGMVKMLISPHYYEWMIKDELWMHTFNAHQKGWLSGIFNDETRSNIIQFVKDFNIFLLINAFLIEILAIFLLYKKRTAYILLIFFDLLHLGIFIESGIFFWKWVFLNIGLIFLVQKLDEESLKTLFSRKYFYLSMLIILCSRLYFKPVQLGWWDVRLNPFFVMEAEGESGKLYTVGKNTMGPYDITFTFDRFLYLVDEKALVPNGPVTQNYQLHKQINSITNLEDLESLKEEKGTNYYDYQKSLKYENFVREIFLSKNEVKENKLLISYLAAPQHLYTNYFVNDNKYEYQEPIRKIKLRYIENYFNGDEVINIKNDVVKEIDIQ